MCEDDRGSGQGNDSSTTAVGCDGARFKAGVAQGHKWNEAIATSRPHLLLLTQHSP